ncbi:hypothetical protein BDA96_03G453100 [Sorghum bicolor]|uniref:Uncharacterized protein n=1 Tax=Sorghum bicolor TaxID=4558 RepID=A0A921UQQ2_SORBI|nr:hypothetical protein BDA96_03G453100 [Sorghum bicolor]
MQASCSPPLRHDARQDNNTTNSFSKERSTVADPLYPPSQSPLPSTGIGES